MTKKNGSPKPLEAKSLMGRLAPVLEMANELGPINQDIDRKALSDWICGNDEHSNANIAARSEA